MCFSLPYIGALCLAFFLDIIYLFSLIGHFDLLNDINISFFVSTVFEICYMCMVWAGENDLCVTPECDPWLSPVPIHIVREASQLPRCFLEPSSDQPLTVGFDCEGVDLARHGRLCIMQVCMVFLCWSLWCNWNGDICSLKYISFTLHYPWWTFYAFMVFLGRENSKYPMFLNISPNTPGSSFFR